MIGSILRRLTFVALLFASGHAAAADSAVVLRYRHFGEDGVPGNVGLAQFEAQLAELRNGGYRVLPLSVLMEALATGRALPDKAVAITIDGAALSVWSEAFPRLAAAGLPFAVFVATDDLDDYQPERMGWSHLREMAAAGAEIGSQGAGRLNMAEAGVAAAGEDLMRAERRFRAELRRAPLLFAWAGGITRAELMQLAESMGMAGARMQAEGAATAGLDRMYLPRQAVDEAVDGPAPFRRLLGAKPLPVADIVPADPRLASNPPPFGFTLRGEPSGTPSCRSSRGHMRVERLGNRVEARADRPFPHGRVSIVCSLGGRVFAYDYWVPRTLVQAGETGSVVSRHPVGAHDGAQRSDIGHAAFGVARQGSGERMAVKRTPGPAVLGPSLTELARR